MVGFWVVARSSIISLCFGVVWLVVAGSYPSYGAKESAVGLPKLDSTIPQYDDKFPNYLKTVSPPNEKPASPEAVATENILALNAAVFPIYNSALAKFKKNLLDDNPILLARFTGQGGAMTLYRPGQQPITANPPPVEYQIAKSVGHSAMAIYQLTAPYLSDPSDKSWQSPMRAFLSRNQSALNSLQNLDIDPDNRAVLGQILNNNVTFMETCLKNGTFSLKDLREFSKRFRPLAPKAIWIAANVQVSHWMKVLDDWNELLGDDWDKLYAATNTIYVTRQNNILFSVIVQYMGKDAINGRLLLLESTEFETSEETMLDLIARIVADRSLGEVYFNDYYAMDIELLSGGSRRAIIEQCEIRNMTPILPPLVPFNSTEWPWHTNPNTGTGPATLNQAE